MHQSTSKKARRGSAWLRLAAMGAAAGGVFLVAAPAHAQYAAEEPEGRAVADNVGPRIQAGGGAYFPNTGNTGGMIGGQIDYGIGAGPLVVAPGARVAGYFGDQGAVTGDGVLTVELPVSVLVPYVQGGLGFGHATGPGDNNLSVLGAAGVNVHVTDDLSIGARGTYETIVNTSFRALGIEPVVAVNF